MTGSGGNGLLQPTNSGCHILNGTSVLLSLSVYTLDNREHSGKLVEKCRVGWGGGGNMLESRVPPAIVAEQTVVEGPESGPNTEAIASVVGDQNGAPPSGSHHYLLPLAHYPPS